jgi:nucleoside-diphosphate-sugar epimerase
VTGEDLCHYFFSKFQLDVRSLRYSGLISYQGFSGGGTSDYAVEIFIEALKHRRYICFVSRETRMPMMYMDDAIKATLDLMEADPETITVRTGYNLGALSFSAGELADEVAKVVCEYLPDFRQVIADSWPNSIDDSAARQDWNWTPHYDLTRLTEAMFAGLKNR